MLLFKEKIIGWYLNRKQLLIDEEFMKNGFSHELYEEQLKVNKCRNKYNISDEDSLNEYGFSQ